MRISAGVFREDLGFDVREANLLDHGDAEAFVMLLNAYIGDAMGGGSIIDGVLRKKLLADLQAHPSKLILLARKGAAYVGMLVGFWGYSTFRVGPLLNIHDIVVLPVHRRQGVARELMVSAEARAREDGCRKMTLEVRSDNDNARRLYLSLGYGECQPSMSFWMKSIDGSACE